MTAAHNVVAQKQADLRCIREMQQVLHGMGMGGETLHHPKQWTFRECQGPRPQSVSSIKAAKPAYRRSSLPLEKGEESDTPVLPGLHLLPGSWICGIVTRYCDQNNLFPCSGSLLCACCSFLRGQCPPWKIQIRLADECLAPPAVLFLQIHRKQVTLKHFPKAVRGDSPDNRSLTSSIVSSMVFLNMPL